MVARFLDENKPKTSIKKWIRTASNFIDLIQFHLIWQMLAKFCQDESERTVFKFRKRKKTTFVLCSPAPQSEPVKLGIFMSQGCNDGKEMNKISWCTCIFVVFSIKTYYFFVVLLPSPLSLVLLSSRNSATMVTGRHTSPLYCDLPLYRLMLGSSVSRILIRLIFACGIRNPELCNP